jgi:hypothetical protein
VRGVEGMGRRRLRLMMGGSLLCGVLAGKDCMGREV